MKYIYIKLLCYLSSLFICIRSSGIGNNVSKTNKDILHDMAYLLHVRILFIYFAYQFTMKIWRPKTLFLILIASFIFIVLYYNVENYDKIEKKEEIVVKDLAGESLNFDFKFDDTSEDIKIFAKFSESEVKLS